MVQWLTAHVTVNLPEDLHDRIKKHKEIKWAAVAREAMIEYLDMIEKAKDEAKGSEKVQSPKPKV